MRISTVVLIFLGVVASVSAVADDKYAVVKETVEAVQEHRESPRDLGGKKHWKDEFSRPGWSLDSFIIEEISKFGPGTGESYRKEEDKLVVEGDTGYGAQFGGGGDYKYKVSIVYLKVYRKQGDVYTLTDKSSLHFGGAPVSIFFASGQSSVSGFHSIAERLDIANATVLTPKAVVMDADGGNNPPYLNENIDPNNINQRFTLVKIGGYFMIKSQINGRVLDANNGGGLYWHPSPDPNQPNHLWKFDAHGGFSLITSKASGKALDANNGQGIYQHPGPNPSNDNQLWKIDAHSGFIMLMPKVRRNENL